MICRSACLVAIVALLLPLAVGAETDEGFFGFTVSVDGGGVFWNPTLKTITITAIADPSPAREAGILPGEMIIEVQDKVVAGSRANEIKPLLTKKVGEALTIRLQNSARELRWVTIVAGPRPEEG